MRTKRDYLLFNKNRLIQKLKTGNGMMLFGTYIVMTCLMFFLASAALYAMQFKGQTTKTATDSIADGVAIQILTNGGDFDDATDYAEEMRELINDNTGAGIDSVSLDRSAFDSNQISVTAQSSGTYTAMDRIIGFTTSGYMRQSQSTTEFGQSGGWQWPCPVYRRISSRFGWRNCPYHGLEHHDGIDISADIGSPVYATSGGTVIVADSTGASQNGKYVKIDHGNGYISYYLHLSSINVSVGQTVSGGQMIAATGNTGNSTGPHLDFRIYLNGVPQDPLDYVTPPGQGGYV